MCLTARNSLRRPTSPITSRTAPTRFDARRRKKLSPYLPYTLSLKKSVQSLQGEQYAIYPTIHPTDHSTSAPTRPRVAPRDRDSRRDCEPKLLPDQGRQCIF